VTAAPDGSPAAGPGGTYAVGLDIGNATTEAVLARLGAELADGCSPTARTGSGRAPAGVEIVGYDRVPTRGAKGSPASLDAAGRLVHRLERAHGVRVGTIVVAPLRPVTTLTATLPEPAVSTGRLRLVAAGSGTAGGHGTGIGRPYVVGDPSPQEPVVAIVPASRPYQEVLPLLESLADRGLLRAVALERDEAVLLANRLGADVPVVDEVPVDGLAGAPLLAVEVRHPGQPLRLLTDPLRLAAELGLNEEDRAGAVRLAGQLYDRSNAIVAVHKAVPEQSTQDSAQVTLHGGQSIDLATARPGSPGWARSYALSGEAERDVDDLYLVDLAALADEVLARVGSLGSRTVVLAALHADAPYADPGPELARRLGVEVRTAPGEAYAARMGALSTPGTVASTVVVDLGGGTIDVVTATGAVIVAGAGDLVTAATAALLGTSRAAAEWAKRGPAYRVEGARVLLGEDGSRVFPDRPVGTDAVGALVTTGPSGWLPFDRHHAPSEWRALRLRLKSRTLGDNVRRALDPAELAGGCPPTPQTGSGCAPAPTSVVVVGGPAGDDEVLACVARALPPGTAVGRGNTAGVLAHRYAVAYGLLAWLSGDRGHA
jgi:hypothetical protein